MIESSARFPLVAGLVALTLAVPVLTAQVQAPTTPAPAPQTSPAQPASQQPPARTGAAPQRARVANLQFGGFTLQNASLAEVVDSLARQLKLNYILPPKFSGSVTLNTFGDMREIDPKNLLELILKINGYGMVEAGGIYRIVALQDVSHQPIRPETKTKDIEADESLMLNLIFLKYITADELAKVLAQFIGEGGQLVTYTPANLIFILDSRRNMRRTMELVSLFDDNSLANQRVKLYEVKNGRPTDLAHELEGIFKGISMTDKLTTIRFVPVDRINTLIAVAPNPGVFETVDKWLDKLDVAGEVTAGAIDNFVYRVKYGQAEFLSMAIYSLYTGQPMFGGNGGYGGGGFGGGSGFGGGLGGGFGGGGYGGVVLVAVVLAEGAALAAARLTIRARQPAATGPAVMLRAAPRRFSAVLLAAVPRQAARFNQARGEPWACWVATWPAVSVRLGPFWRRERPEAVSRCPTSSPTRSTTRC